MPWLPTRLKSPALESTKAMLIGANYMTFVVTSKIVLIKHDKGFAFCDLGATKYWLPGIRPRGTKRRCLNTLGD